MHYGIRLGTRISIKKEERKRPEATYVSQQPSPTVGVPSWVQATAFLYDIINPTAVSLTIHLMVVGSKAKLFTSGTTHNKHDIQTNLTDQLIR